MWASRRNGRARREAGVAAIVAVAIIVLVGFLGAALVSSVQVTSSAATNHILATQAYYIADAATEWACKEDSATSSPVTFSSGTFEVTADGDSWVCVATAGETKCTVRCQPDATVGSSLTVGLDYVLGSREAGHTDDAEFRLINTSDSAITFNKLKVTWDNPTAYFEEVEIKVEKGTDYRKVWDHGDEPDNYRWGSGETKQFTRVTSVTIPAHYIAEIELKKFKKNRTGGPKRNVKNTEFTIDFYSGSTSVGQITVGLAPN